MKRRRMRRIRRRGGLGHFKLFIFSLHRPTFSGLNFTLLTEYT
jgi:hypothetical protein